jgi:hypothetical protein
MLREAVEYRRLDEATLQSPPERRRAIERQNGISSSSGAEGTAFGGGVDLLARDALEPSSSPPPPPGRLPMS